MKNIIDKHFRPLPPPPFLLSELRVGPRNVAPLPGKRVLPSVADGGREGDW